MNRRRFLELAGGAAVTAVFPYTRVVARSIPEEPFRGSATESHWTTPEWLHLDQLQPNLAANMVNMVVVPEELYARTNREQIKMAVDFRSTFNPSNPMELQNDLWGYGESVRDALKRDQIVWLVLDLPDDYSVSLELLSLYFQALAQRFSVRDDHGELQTARFVIGNELNAFAHTSTDQYVQWYAQAYLTASTAMRQVHPDVKLFPASDAYYGSGEVLTRILKAIQGAGDGAHDLRAVVSGLGFHFYDNCSKLVERTSVYAQIARQFSLDPKQLHLLELSKSEGGVLGFTTFDHQQVIIRNLTTALALVRSGTLQTTMWHTAEQVGDPNGHALFMHDKDQFKPKPQYSTFELLSKLLYQITRFEEQQVAPSVFAVTCVAVTSEGDQVNISWRRFRNLAGELTYESEPTIVFGLSGKELHRRELLTKPWKYLFE